MSSSSSLKFELNSYCLEFALCLKSSLFLFLLSEIFSSDLMSFFIEANLSSRNFINSAILLACFRTVRNLTTCDYSRYSFRPYTKYHVTKKRRRNKNKFIDLESAKFKCFNEYKVGISCRDEKIVIFFLFNFHLHFSIFKPNLVN